MSVRLIINTDLTGVLIIKMTNGAGGYKPGTLIRNESIPMGRHGTALLLTRVLQTDFLGASIPGPGRQGGRSELDLGGRG